MDKQSDKGQSKPKTIIVSQENTKDIGKTVDTQLLLMKKLRDLQR